MPEEQGEMAPRIVAGADGSSSAQAALHWAFRQARLTGAVLEAVLAWEVPIALGRFGTARDVPREDTEFRQAAEQVLAEAVAGVADAAGGVEVRPQALEGNAAAVLLAAARGADLLVVGSRGHGGFAGALLGSVSLQCVQHAPCPVVVVRG